MKLSKYWMVAAMVAAVGAAQAALIDRGGGLIYDTTRNITWLADMNYAKTSGYAPGGLMDWTTANRWASELVYGGYDDWRLPTLNPSDTTCSNTFSPGGGFPLQYLGYNCTGGELSGLFVADLGNKARESVLDQTGDTAEQIANLALFRNVQSNYYWSGTLYAPNPDVPWNFATFIGFQAFSVPRTSTLYAVAVRPGDVVASVPEPQTLALALLALVVTTAMRRRTLRP